MNACNCVGPQNGQPVCPCAMRDVSVVNGRYVMTKDLGPAGVKPDHELTAFEYAQKRLTKLREFLIQDAQSADSVFNKYDKSGKGGASKEVGDG